MMIIDDDDDDNNNNNNNDLKFEISIKQIKKKEKYLE